MRRNHSRELHPNKGSMSMPAEYGREWLRAREAQKYDADYFASHYWAEDLPGRCGNRDLSYDDEDHSRRCSLLADLLLQHFQFETVLDAGCGLGGVLANLQLAGKEAQGCDVSEFAVSHCNARGIPCQLASLHDLPFANERFDLVFCSDVLEHLIVDDAIDAVHELTRVTRRNLVLTINLDNPYRFHPTILSRDTWISLFLRSTELTNDESSERLVRVASNARPEYDWFCFRRAITAGQIEGAVQRKQDTM